ncbi:hypothetical protein [Granulicella tundricola]|nr:hypothetical protein [Granulicella tundricola]
MGSQDAEGFGKLDPKPPTGLTTDEIVKKFGARETAFNQALNEYTFRRTVRVETLAEDTNKVDGVYQDVTDIVLSDNGGRSEHVVFAPQNTLERVMMTQSDFDDITHRLPFILTTKDLPQYDLTYMGRQHVDDLDTYVFEAAPKTLVKGQRYFQGRIWVDQKDLQIVLINGKTVPQDMRRGHEDLSPPYTTYYSEVDGGYWFPVYTHAEGNLHFAAANGALAQDVHIRYTVKYADYKRFHAKSRIIYNGETLPAADPSKPDTPEKTNTEPTAQPAADPNAPNLKHTKPQP